MEHNQLTIRTYMAIMAERDAAVRERNLALEERKRAFAERDMAMLQRDAAIAERNSAIQEREGAIASLRFRESSMNDNNLITDSPGNTIISGTNYVHNLQPIHHMPNSAEAASNASQITAVAKTAKHRRVKQTKEVEPLSTKPTKSRRVDAEGAAGLKNQVTTATSNGWETAKNLSDREEMDRQLIWEDNTSVNLINFDESAMPVPVCSCTGVPQPCYKWGNGGWQSACCTTTMSMYPLPQVPNKRYSRVGGRKMSGSAFTKLLNRLAAVGHDLYMPLDLKDHWAKHGTNRYSTLK